MTARDIWGPRHCKRCGAWPGESCRTKTGGRAGLPHRERFPLSEDGRPRVYGKKLAEQRRKRQERAEAARRLPLDLALRMRLEERQEAFRAEKAA